MTGPVQGRRGDSRILEESQLEDVILLLQQRTGVNYIIYADAAYAETATLMTGYKKHQRVADANKEWLSKSLNGPRTSVEWAFGLVPRYFPWVDDVSANNISVTPGGVLPGSCSVDKLHYMRHRSYRVVLHLLQIRYAFTT